MVLGLDCLSMVEDRFLLKWRSRHSCQTDFCEDPESSLIALLSSPCLKSWSPCLAPPLHIFLQELERDLELVESLFFPESLLSLNWGVLYGSLCLEEEATVVGGGGGAVSVVGGMTKGVHT